MKQLTVAISIASLCAMSIGMDAETLIAKNIQARGGAEAWSKIESIRATGTFTAFSVDSPFTLHRKRPNLYHIDHTLNEKKVVIGYDGEELWWENHWFQAAAQPIEGLDRQVIMRDVHFVSPFFDYQKHGFTVSYMGETDFEGMPALALELTRADDFKETWFFDPETFLEIGCDSPGSDFGTPAPQRTFFDDFREVEGVKIPFYVEAQWYTRARAMTVENVELNLKLDDDLFQIPMPPGMGELRHLEGQWDVAVQQRNQPGAPWQDQNYDSTISSTFRGGMLEEKFTSDGSDVVRTISFDSAQAHYRITQIDSQRMQMNIMQGAFEDEAGLVATNLETGTPWKAFGYTIYRRFTVYDITPDGFKTRLEASIDEGANWFEAVKAVYTRSSE